MLGERMIFMKKKCRRTKSSMEINVCVEKSIYPNYHKKKKTKEFDKMFVNLKSNDKLQ